MQFRVIVITDPQTHTHTNPQTGPITISWTAAPLAHSVVTWTYAADPSSETSSKSQNLTSLSRLPVTILRYTHNSNYSGIIARLKQNQSFPKTCINSRTWIIGYTTWVFSIKLDMVFIFIFTDTINVALWCPSVHQPINACEPHLFVLNPQRGMLKMLCFGHPGSETRGPFGPQL